MSTKPVFVNGFSNNYACDGDTIELDYHGLVLVASLHDDDDKEAPDERVDGFWPSLDPADNGYIGPKSKRTLARRMALATEVMRAWKNDEWCYVGVCVRAGIRDEFGEIIWLTDEFAHAIWGVECNYPAFSEKERKARNSYLTETANDFIEETYDEGHEELIRLVQAAQAWKRK